MRTPSFQITLGVLIFAFTAQAAPPPELTALQQQYVFAVAERVTSPYDTGSAALNEKFLAALANAAAEAQKAGRLPEILAIDEDKKLIVAKLPLPEGDDEKTPESLKKLRGIYRAASAKLMEQRQVAHAALLPAYTARLQALESTLPTGGRLEEAKEVLKYRESVGADLPPPDVATKPAAVSSPLTTPVSSKGKAAKDVPEAARRIAEWALNNKHYVLVEEIGRKGESRKVTELPGLPKGKFVVLKIEYDSRMSPGTVGPFPWDALTGTASLYHLYLDLDASQHVNMADLDKLTGLDNLNHLQIGGKMQWEEFDAKRLPVLRSVKRLLIGKVVTDGDLAEVHAAFPDLEYLMLYFKDYPAAEFDKLRLWKGLTSLRLDGAAAALKPEHIETLNQMPKLNWLVLYPFGAVMDPAVSELKNVFNVDLIYDHPVETFRAICSIPNLTRLMCSQNNKLVSEDFKAVEKIKNLEILELKGMNSVDDSVLPTIVALKGLKELDLFNTKVTDALFDAVKGMRKLKSLRISGTQVSAAGLAAFKKERPDMKVDK